MLNLAAKLLICFYCDDVNNVAANVFYSYLTIFIENIGRLPSMYCYFVLLMGRVIS